MTWCCFEQAAMNTVFTIRLPGETDGAGGLAQVCFERLLYLESRLSAFMDGSDIWQINRMDSGQELFISPECHACLLIALEIQQQTQGVFNVAYATPHSGRLVIAPDRPHVHCIEAGSRLDLGAIGKGFALDAVGTLLQEWGAGEALVSAGASTHLATGETTWPISLEGTGRLFELRQGALSASGTRLLADHIAGPEGVSDHQRRGTVWVKADTAARADAWSTVAFLMDPSSLQEILPASVQFLESIPASGNSD